MIVKITINSEDRIVVLPLEYDVTTDTATLQQIQIEPVPNETDDISKDVVLNIAQGIITMLKGN